jgi:hypothetical protein
MMRLLFKFGCKPNIVPQVNPLYALIYDRAPNELILEYLKYSSFDINVIVDINANSLFHFAIEYIGVSNPDLWIAFIDNGANYYYVNNAGLSSLDLIYRKSKKTLLEICINIKIDPAKIATKEIAEFVAKIYEILDRAKIYDANYDYISDYSFLENIS